jgi:catechol 2,3-dioxygenase-like lactoylglutathione lyase family enzyme
MINSIEHIAIAASDPAALAQWYCATLGFTMVVARAESKTYFVGVPGGGMVEIIAVDPKAHGQEATHTVGLHHLALAVSDFAGVAQTLQARGIQFSGPAYRSADGGTQFDFFTDPEGNRLQLVQRARPLGS